MGSRFVNGQAPCARYLKGRVYAFLHLLLWVGLLGSATGSGWAQAATLTFSGKTKVGSSSEPTQVTVTIQQGGVAGSAVALTSGVANLDFAISDTGGCGVGSMLVAGQTCTMNVIFSPRFPGVREGAVVVPSADNKQVLGSARLSGIGQGGLPVLVPGEINTVAGVGEQWVYHGDGVAATSAPIFLPTGLAVDGAGNLFFSDSSNNRVRRVDASSGLISTVAGNGTAGPGGDGTSATAAELNNPSGLVLDGAGNLFIADSGNNVVRKVDAVTGVISTIAGRMGASGFGGDGDPATSASLTSPQGLALTLGGDLLIADTSDDAVRLVTFADGKIQTIAGTGTAGYNGDNVAAVTAQLSSPRSVAVRFDGAIAIADFGNERVRLVDTSGNITTVAGTGSRGFSGDGSQATQALLSEPAAVAFDPAGDLLIADSGNNRVRGVYGSPGIITTLAGNASQEFAGDAGPANSASLYGPYGLFFDPQGNIWISDMFHNRVREISGALLGISYPTMKVGKTSAPVLEALYNGGNDNLTLAAPTLQQAALDLNTTTCNQSPMMPMVFCDMGIQFAPTQIGQNVAGSITWKSDAPNVKPVDDLNGQVLSVEPTSVVISSTTNPGLLGAPVPLVATVTSDASSVTGTVTFMEGSNPWCSGVPLQADKTATCDIQSLSLGTHTFTAVYTGDNNNAASTSAPFEEVIKQQPALALAVSSSPAVVTSNVILTLKAADQTGIPTGTVTFLDGTTVLATEPLNAAGIATWSTQTFAVGAHSLTAQYSGDAANAAGPSNTVLEQVNQATTLTVLSSSDSSPTVGTPVVLHASVVSNNGPAPTGSVQFMDSTTSTVLGTAPLSAQGSATTTLSTLNPGNHSLAAVYMGDTDNAQSTSVAVAEAVQQITTVTTLGADANPLNAGATLHLTAIVSVAQGAGTDGALSGIVTFTDGVTVLGTAPINSTGQASLAVSTLAVGQHTVVASYGGSTNYATSSSVAIHEVVQQTQTQVGLTATDATTLAGKPVTFNAVVTSTTGTPTGTISFRDGTVVLGSVALNSSAGASLTTSALLPGTHAITAVYNGDANYLAGTSATVQHTVQLAQPNVVLSGPSTPVDAGTASQVTATLSTPGVAPTGTLTLLDGATTVASKTVTGAGFSFSTAGLRVGAHVLTVAYSGDANNAAVVSQSLVLVVQQAASATTLNTSANPLTHGGALTLSAAVSSDGPNLSGAVNFFDGTTLLGTVSLGANGSASLSVPALTLGTHALTAVYAGDTSHAGSTSPAIQEFVVQSSSEALSSSNNPSQSGQNVTFTAQISSASAVVGTGSVSFRDNGALLATVPLNGAGVATLTTSALSVGAHAIVASYTGDTNLAAASAQLTQTVNDATTQVSLTGSTNPATYSQPLSLTATVTSDGGMATGTVNFTEGGQSIGSAQLDATGVAVLTSSTLAPGSHSVVAHYLGDGKASPSASTPLAVVVKQVTGLAVSASVNPALTLSPVTFTATLKNPGAAAATGTVIFTDGATNIGSAQLDGSGHATLTLAKLTAGTHSITASYPGDGANFGSTSSTYTETVQLRSTTTTVTSSLTDPNNPQQVTLIAVVSGAGSVPPSGTVTFMSGALMLGAADVDDTGVATITVLFEQTTEPVVASYSGDISYASSQSSTTTITAGQAPQFTLSINVPNVTLVTTQHTTVNVTIGSVKGFTDTIALGCMGLPTAATCTFSSSQVKLNPDGTATASLIVDTGDPLGAGTGASANASLQRPSGKTLLCGLPMCALLVLLRRRRLPGLKGQLGSLLLVLVAVGLTMGVTGCAGLQTKSTPPGTYSFKVVGTGQGSGTTEAQVVTLVVTQ